MRTAIVGVLILAAGLTVSVGCAPSEPVRRGPASRYRGEEAPTFRVSEVLPASIIRGPNYQIEEFVPVVDYGYQFRIRSAFGIIPAHGTDMLELRLREINAIHRAYVARDAPQQSLADLEVLR